MNYIWLGNGWPVDFLFYVGAFYSFWRFHVDGFARFQ
jgi:hypothetical protein